MRSSGVAGLGSLWMALAILFFSLILRASALDVLLTTQQSFNLDGNTTLVIEDANSQQGVIWIKLYSRKETVDSAVIRLGGHLRYAGRNITFRRIYSGGDSDLVSLRIEREKALTYIANASIANTINVTDPNGITSDLSLMVHCINATANNTTSIVSILAPSNRQFIGQNASQRPMAALLGSQSQRYPPSF